MADTFTQNEFDKKGLPSALNVLTILSIIGCVFQFFGGIYQYYNAKKTYENRDEVMKQLESAPEFLRKMTGTPEEFAEMTTKAYENRMPILAIGLLGAILCFVGVMQMRKLKKQGFTLYSVGELLPVVGSIALMGIGSIASFGGIVGTVIPIAFVLIYATQRKHLIN